MRVVLKKFNNFNKLQVFILTVVLTGTFFLVGCAAERSRMKALEPAVMTFNSQVRWGRVEQASMYVPQSVLSDFRVKLSTLRDDLEIVSYEVITTTKTRDGVEILVRFEWLRHDEGVLLKSWVREKWRNIGEKWYCVALQGVRGEPWPLEYRTK